MFLDGLKVTQKEADCMMLPGVCEAFATRAVTG